MTETEFKNKYDFYKNVINRYLDEVSSYNPCPEEKVYEAMRYSLLAGGKRIRPVFVLAFADMLGLPEGEVFPFAAAIEMIHTYSLIHDDLPAMDNDELRRGKPTNHVVYGEAIAILAGDALLNRAFEITSEAALNQNDYMKMKNSLEAMKILTQASGTKGMIAGQAVDMEAEHRIISADELKYMHVNKTGALIKASCTMPFALSGISDYMKIEQFAEYVGLVFQMKDDILDIESSEEVLGKPIGSDIKQGKSTFVTIYGIDKCKELLDEYTAKAIDIAEEYGSNANFIKKLVLYLLEREN